MHSRDRASARLLRDRAKYFLLRSLMKTKKGFCFLVGFEGLFRPFGKISNDGGTLGLLKEARFIFTRGARAEAQRAPTSKPPTSINLRDMKTLRIGDRCRIE